METEKQCKRCKAMQELLKDVEQRNSYITQLKDKMEKMKEAALEEKKRHTDVNNEIIRSNARYHKTLSETEAKYQTVLKEKEQILKELYQKDILVATLQAEKQTLKEVTDSILQKLESLPTSSFTSSTSTTAASTSSTSYNASSASELPITEIEMEDDSPLRLELEHRQLAEDVTNTSQNKHSNAKTNLSLNSSSQHNNNKKKLKKKKKLKANELPTTATTVPTEAAELPTAAARESHTDTASLSRPQQRQGKQDEGISTDSSTCKPAQLAAGTEGSAASRRRRAAINYAEPSLKKKLRQGDTHTFYSDDVLLSAAKQLSKAQQAKENFLSQEELFLKHQHQHQQLSSSARQPLKSKYL